MATYIPQLAYTPKGVSQANDPIETEAWWELDEENIPAAKLNEVAPDFGKYQFLGFLTEEEPGRVILESPARREPDLEQTTEEFAFGIYGFLGFS